MVSRHAKGRAGDAADRGNILSGEKQSPQNSQAPDGKQAVAGASATRSWRDVLPIHPAAELFPLMNADELQELAKDIKKNGLRVPIVLGAAQCTDEPCLWDGRNRLDAIELVGFKLIKRGKLDKCLGLPNALLPEQMATIEVVFAEDPYAYVLSANVHRRQLAAEQKRDLIAKLLKAQPGKSDRQIAETVKASPTTVGKTRKSLEERGDVSRVDTSIDTKGRKQPRQRKAEPVEKAKAKGARAAVEVSTTITTDIGATSSGETERLQARVGELENKCRRLEIENTGLKSELAELKAEIERFRRKPEQARAAIGDDYPDIPPSLRRALPVDGSAP